MQRTAHFRYLFGTWLVLVPFMAIGAYLIIDPRSLFDLSDNEQLLMASTLAGTAGAVLSVAGNHFLTVMTRLSGRNLKLTGQVGLLAGLTGNSR